jgi:hypothetical protein
MKTTAIILGIVVIALIGILIFYNPAAGPTVPSNSAPVSQEAVSPDGHVIVFSPLTDGAITSPVSIQGTVVNGGWFSNATFPIKILDGDGTVIGQGVAQAGGGASAWMSTATISFSATITFTMPKYATGTIVLEKTNPSGAATSAEQMSIPVQF